jgi:hypothetical protein
MPPMTHDAQACPTTTIDDVMTSPRPLLRVHLELQTGSLLSVLERLHLAGQSPRLMVFYREEDATGRMVLDFDRVNEPAAETLVLWLEQLTGVMSVATEWRPVRTPAG